ncbi:28 kDa ribonucleoprotein, chloroplastic [Lolium perenne]|nr:28 kDa ribonucleoprotein, chloroplastic [Lolium perenne]XP_051219362.1 28 kDa ribonucleoprotein, chloroplastic [Lolium perenne]
MALSLARSSPHPAAAPPAPRISHFATILHSPRRPYPGLRLRLRLPAAAVAASSPPEAQAAEPTAAAAEGDAEPGKTRRKVFVGNMPWTFSAAEIQKLFSECGVVKDVEVIKLKDGRKRGFAFVTMSTTEEAAAAVEKFNEHDLMGRIIKVEFSKSFRKPAPPPSPDTIVAKYKLYVSNLAWKARSNNLKEFFLQYNPVSANVVFDDKKSAGYGFVSFGTKEEAESALSELDGKELMGRPVLLRWREDKEVVKADGEVEGVKVSDQPEGAVIDKGAEEDTEDKQE